MEEANINQEDSLYDILNDLSWDLIDPSEIPEVETTSVITNASSAVATHAAQQNVPSNRISETPQQKMGPQIPESSLAHVPGSHQQVLYSQSPEILQQQNQLLPQLDTQSSATKQQYRLLPKSASSGTLQQQNHQVSYPQSSATTQQQQYQLLPRPTSSATLQQQNQLLQLSGNSETLLQQNHRLSQSQSSATKQQQYQQVPQLASSGTLQQQNHQVSHAQTSSTTRQQKYQQPANPGYSGTPQQQSNQQTTPAPQNRPNTLAYDPNLPMIVVPLSSLEKTRRMVETHKKTESSSVLRSSSLLAVGLLNTTAAQGHSLPNLSGSNDIDKKMLFMKSFYCKDLEQKNSRLHDQIAQLEKENKLMQLSHQRALREMQTQYNQKDRRVSLLSKVLINERERCMRFEKEINDKNKEIRKLEERNKMFEATENSQKSEKSDKDKRKIDSDNRNESQVQKECPELVQLLLSKDKPTDSYKASVKGPDNEPSCSSSSNTGNKLTTVKARLLSSQKRKLSSDSKGSSSSKSSRKTDTIGCWTWIKKERDGSPTDEAGT